MCNFRLIAEGDVEKNKLCQGQENGRDQERLGRQVWRGEIQRLYHREFIMHQVKIVGSPTKHAATAQRAGFNAAVLNLRRSARVLDDSEARRSRGLAPDDKVGASQANAGVARGLA